MAESNDLAQRLIDTVRRELNEEAALVQDRVAYALEYVDNIARPNMHTLQHIRWILTGEYDNTVRIFASKKES